MVMMSTSGATFARRSGFGVWEHGVSYIAGREAQKKNEGYHVGLAALEGSLVSHAGCRFWVIIPPPFPMTTSPSPLGLSNIRKCTFEPHIYVYVKVCVI